MILFKLEHIWIFAFNDAVDEYEVDENVVDGNVVNEKENVAATTAASIKVD